MMGVIAYPLAYNYKCLVIFNQCRISITNLFGDGLKCYENESKGTTLFGENLVCGFRKYLPKVRVIHPYPEMHFCARYSK